MEKMIGLFITKKYNFHTMKNLYDIFITYFKIKNSKVLIFIVPFFPLAASASFYYKNHIPKNNNQIIKEKNIGRTKYDFFNDYLISNNVTDNLKNQDKNNSNSLPSNLEKYSDDIKFRERLSGLTQENKDNEQEIELESIQSQNDSFTDDLKKEVDKTIYNTNLKNINKPVVRVKTKKNIDNTPPSGEISVGEFLIQPRGYINLKGPKITLNIIGADPLQTLKFLAKSGNYGFLFINNSSIEEDGEDKENSIKKITANFVNQDYSRVFNSVLMASELQAKFEKGIIFVGKDIYNKSLVPKISKTYRINQASASSVGDYLSTLGAKISKVMVKSSAIAGDELGDSLRSEEEINENFINSYGTEGGPLNGLIGTVDLRLQTITLVGEKTLIASAEKYIKSLDVRHRQVALSVQIIDVALTKSDLTNNRFELLKGATTVFSNGGLGIITGNNAPMFPDGNSAVQSPSSGTALPSNNLFVNWLERKITNDNAKIIASPTLILGENQEPIVSGAAAVDDSLGSATIGRPFANEAFIKVGENVITSFEANTSEGVTTCTAVPGIAGITFGAKLNKIDDNGFVTFSLSPAISSVTKTETVANCGTQSTLSVRRLDTGIIRVKDGNTLVLTGVLKDEDTINTTKTPLLGDLPIFGRLFRNNTTLKRKSELIILVTPRVLKEEQA